MKYQDKENYITRDPDPWAWMTHANFRIMQAHGHLIHGKCGDLGCNHGSCTILLHCFPIEAVYGFDINEASLKIAAEMSIKHGKKITYQAADLTALPVKDDFFDFLMSFHTLEHIYEDDSDAVVSEMFRTLKPGGHLLISIPYSTAWGDPCHVCFYTESNLQLLFEKHKFVTLECFKDDRFLEKNLLTAIFKKPECNS